MLRQQDLAITSLGTCSIPAPMRVSKKVIFVPDSTRVRLQNEVGPEVDDFGGVTFEKAGPRQTIFFDPAQVTAALVTCGGLCPGLNNVIRSLFLELTYNYGVKRILGIRNGYAGLNPASGFEPVELTSQWVEQIHKLGGTALGSSRGAQEPAVIVDFLERRKVDVLFTIGGDGTQRGAHAIYEEIRKRGLSKAVVGIPKTIDNDIRFCWMTFGYATALEKAEEVLRAAHIEARGAPNGIGLVKVMGRDAGFIAAGAALASQEANFVLVPEVPFPLEGEDGFLTALQRRIEARGHALIVAAEGAGQHLLRRGEEKRDASGNILHGDIGIFLKTRITEHFRQRGVPINLKYLDPSYLIRSIPANAWDRILSDSMARNAVHAGMAGKTDLIIGFWDRDLIHVPIPVATAERKRMELSSDLWTAVLACTGQPQWA